MFISREEYTRLIRAQEEVFRLRNQIEVLQRELQKAKSKPKAKRSLGMVAQELGEQQMLPIDEL